MNTAALQTGIYENLTLQPDIQSGSIGVYADVQQPNLPEDDSAFPYITIGQDNVTAFDTKTWSGINALCQIDVWSRQKNLMEVKQVGQYVYEALHKRRIYIDGARWIESRFESADYSIDPDGHTKRGMLMFRVLYYGT
jgi:hypothetical protein